MYPKYLFLSKWSHVPLTFLSFGILLTRLPTHYILEIWTKLNFAEQIIQCMRWASWFYWLALPDNSISSKLDCSLGILNWEKFALLNQQATGIGLGDDKEKSRP